MPPKLLDDIWAFCDPFLKVCDDIEGLLTENRIFKQRNVGIAVVKLADAWGRGFSGVMVRGSGAAWEIPDASRRGPIEISPVLLSCNAARRPTPTTRGAHLALGAIPAA